MPIVGLTNARDAIALIQVDGTGIRGTGFLVAPGIVATALHVVADRNTNPPTFVAGKIQLTFPEQQTDAYVLDQRWSRDADCVLLQCVAPIHSQPLPLQHLDNSDGAWRTFGFPDAQPIDGMVMEGRVRDHQAQLTNYYFEQASRYQPVLQLFCNECSAGNGAPVRGLSGSPVISRGAVVGLMRYALMQDGQTVAGTIYACSAKDIAELWPEQLKPRPALAPPATLTHAQRHELISILTKGFENSPKNLWSSIRYSLGMDLSYTSGPSSALTHSVSSVVDAAMQRGIGTVQMLIVAGVSAQPSNALLLAFAANNFPTSLQLLNEQDLLNAIVRALLELAQLRRYDDLQQIFISYQTAFDGTRQKVGILSKYKALHTSLHELQRVLPYLSSQVEQLQTEPVPANVLKEMASFLKDLSERAQTHSTGLATQSYEEDWISELNNCALDLRNSTLTNASQEDRERVFDVPGRLNRVLAQSARINRELVEAAKGVQLDDFAQAIDMVEDRLKEQLTDDILIYLREGSRCLGIFRARLSGLIKEHDEWQELNSLLELARASQHRQLQRRISSWEQFRDRLISLCDAFPGEEWSQDIKSSIQPWIANPCPPEPRLRTLAIQMQEEFEGLYHTCVSRFVKVDLELDALCGKIVQLTVPLDTLLGR